MYDYSELRRQAEAATPGPWRPTPYDGHGMDAACTDIATDGKTVIGQLGCSCCDVGLEGRPEDAAYIAAANPTVVLELLDRLEAAEDALERFVSREDFDAATQARMN